VIIKPDQFSFGFLFVNFSFKFNLLQIMNNIYSNPELANYFGLKCGIVLMFFHNLPRFSANLDFNPLELTREDVVYQKVRIV
jgi:hypothetical protein